MLPTIEMNRATNESNSTTVKKYIEWGKKLIDHKKSLPHGQWLPTIEKEYGKDKIRTIQTAMNLAKYDIDHSLYPLGIQGILDHLRSTNKKESSKGERIIKQHVLRKNPNKQFVESLFLTVSRIFLGDIKTRCLTITGPDYNRHVEKLFRTLAKHVYIVEISNSVFKRISNWAYRCEHFKKGNVSLFKGNVSDILIPNCRYIDLDLMASISELVPIITKHVFSQTTSCGANDTKCLTFTASTRNDKGKNERFKVFKSLINSLFGCQFIGFQGKGPFGKGIQVPNLQTANRSYCQRHIPLFKDMGRLLDMEVIQYADEGTPMLSVLISYK